MVNRLFVNGYPAETVAACDKKLEANGGGERPLLTNKF